VRRLSDVLRVLGIRVEALGGIESLLRGSVLALLDGERVIEFRDGNRQASPGDFSGGVSDGFGRDRWVQVDLTPAVLGFQVIAS